MASHYPPRATNTNYSDIIFFGEYVHTTVTCDPNIVTQWISEIEESFNRDRHQQLIVGLDAEWRPSFERGVSHPLATLQLCVGYRCLIIQLIHSPYFPQSLVDFLANPRYRFVGVGIDQDVEKLQNHYGFGFNTKTVDLRELAAERYGQTDLRSSGVTALARLVLEKEVDKPRSVTLSRWDNYWLTPVQVSYACVDAFVCYEIGRVLNASSPGSNFLMSSWIDFDS